MGTIEDLYMQGLSVTAIAKKTGDKWHVVDGEIRRLGIKRNKKEAA